MTWRPLTTCVACAAGDLVPFLCLGPQPLANSFLEPAADHAPEPFYPLDVAYCASCGHVQLTAAVDRTVMFSHYLYVSGTSDAVPAHFQELAAQVRDMLDLTARDLVVEAGSNDGTLLRAFQSHKVRVLGVEPAQNIAATALARGVPTRNTFFESRTAAEVRESEGPARVIVGTNVFAHVADPADFLTGVRQLLAPDGLVVIEVPYLVPMLEKLEFDTIYHEHVSYFGLGPLTALFERCGLELVGALPQSIHGGSIRIFGRPRAGGAGPGPLAGRVSAGRVSAGGAPADGVPAGGVLAGEPGRKLQELLERERALELPTGAPQRAFAARVQALPAAIGAMLAKLESEGKRVAGYGAAAKGSTLLNYCRITRWQLPWIADKAPHKQNRLAPGTHIPIVDPARIAADRPDVLFLLAWNFAEEIMRQQAAHKERGGRFLLPLPEPVLI